MDQQGLRIDQEGIKMDANQVIKNDTCSRNYFKKCEKIAIGHETVVVICYFLKISGTNYIYICFV